MVARRAESSVVVEAPVEKVYDYWKDLENLTYFLSNVEEVRSTGEDTSYWRVKGPFGTKMEFEARTTQNEPNSAIGWNSVEGDVQSSGQVRFEELGSGRTRVEVTMNYADLPGGAVGEAAAGIVADPQVMLEQDLRNFKEIMEGTATPEEVQQRVSAASAQSGALAFLTSGTGLLILGGLVLLFWLFRRDNSSKRARIIFEF